VPEQLHLTLAFLGRRPAGEVAAIAAELRAAAEAAGPVELRPLRYRETRSVGMVVYQDANGMATALAEDVQARLERLGAYRREQRRWLPHVTVVRFREQAGLRLAPPNRCSIHDVRAALYRSDLRRGPGKNSGARYTELETAALGGR
jgi:2'-5' RNA ligase